jgi:thiol-disulfide isomerase/thioredoxin
MKKITMILVALSFLYSCKNLQNPDNRIVIAGELIGAAGEILTVHTFEELNRTLVNNDGTFHITVSHDHPFYFNISAKNQIFQLYLEPGDSIYVNADMEDFYSTFRAAGDKVLEATFLTKKGKLFREFGPLYAFFDLPANDYQQKKAEHFSPFIELFKEMGEEKGLNRDFLTLEHDFIEYYELNMDRIYPSSFRRAHGIPDHEPIDFPEQEITDKINNLNLDDPLKIYLLNHRLFIDRRTRNLQAEMYKEIPDNEKSTTQWMKYMLLAADSLYKHPKVNSFAKYWFLYHHLTMEGPSGIEESYNLFIRENTIPMYTKRLEKILQNWEILQPGQAIPDFTFSDPDGNTVSLQDLKGKPAYVLVWDTGCGPCRYEHTFWNNLTEEFHNILFITISFDREKEEWLSYLDEKPICGINWRVENHFISPFANHFMIKGVPRFILIDAEGKIANANPPRASGAIREELEKLL